MTVVTPPRPPRSNEPPDQEALIEEARQRARRRRLLYVTITLAVAVGIGIAAGAYVLVHVQGGSTAAPARVDQATQGSGAGELLLYGSLTYGHVIYGVRPDGTHLRRLTRTGSERFAVSPDGKRIVFARTRRPPGRGRQPEALFVLDMASRRVHRVTPWSAGGYRGPAWALGGRRIVYGRCSLRPFGECPLWSIRTDGSSGRDLTEGLTTNGNAAVSPDGRWIAFSTSIATLSFPTPGNLYLERIDGTRRRVLTRGVISPPLSWSRQGLIAVEDMRGRITLLSPSGRRSRLSMASESPPIWSPDGTKLAFAQANNLYVGNANGKGFRPVSRPGKSTGWLAAWSPDGTRLAYAESRPHVHSSIVVVDVTSRRVLSVTPFKRPTDVVAWRSR